MNGIMNRRNFLRRSITALAIAAMPAIFLRCGGNTANNSVSPGSGGDCLANGTDATIENNHGHDITVSAEDISAGTDKAYDIQGTAGHSHTVNLTAADFTSLKGNDGIEVVSSSDAGHTHNIVINCA